MWVWLREKKRMSTQSTTCTRRILEAQFIGLRKKTAAWPRSRTFCVKLKCQHIPQVQPEDLHYKKMNALKLKNYLLVSFLNSEHCIILFTKNDLIFCIEEN